MKPAGPDRGVSIAPAGNHEAVPFPVALRYWTRLGFISFGGPAGQIAIMQRDLVDRRRWISQERFLHALSFCMLLPGPEAQQLAIYIGWLLHGTWGGIVAGALFVVPSIAILWLLSAGYAAYGHLPAIAGIVAGLKPAVVALVLVALVRVGSRALRPRSLVAIAAAAFVGIYFFHVPFPWVILGAGVLGFLRGRFVRASDDVARDEGELPGPPNPRPLRRAAAILLSGIALWAGPLVLLATWLGWSSLQVQQYKFFTKAALVTFGGAYAVLAYVTQAAVQSYHWITQAQAIDGLGLAETTPGPLIMVLQFVGFMSAWNHPGPLGRLASATAGALVTTWVTFLPCFIFVLLGAPYVERLRGNRNLRAALSGITAAVVGVILNLAVVFGTAVLLPGGWSHAPDLFALVLTLVALAALLLFDVDAVWVVLGGGIVGLARALIG